MYYFKYNGIDLTQLVKVREVQLPSLPPIEHDSIEMWEMDGDIFNSLSYGNREIEITAIIQPLDPNDLEGYTNDVKRAFFVREPQPLFLGDETKYILAAPEGDVTITELGKGTSEMAVTLIAYTPYWIAKEVIEVEGDVPNKKGGLSAVVENTGDVPATPIISIGVGGDTTFFQIENTDTKERVLIGELPKTQKTNKKAQSLILHDECQSTSGWTESSAALDSGCATGGTLGITESGKGICIGTFGNGSGDWKGASYRKNLSTPLTDFKVKANFSFNSTGKNGDPTKTETIKYHDNIGTIYGGTVSYTYTVSVKTSLDIRSGPGTRYKRIGSYKNGAKLEGTPTNGWLKHTYNGKTAYVSMQYINTTAVENRSTEKICNFVTNKATAVRSSADGWSNSKATIPAGTVIRCFVSEATKKKGTGKDATEEGTGYRKLFVSYNGKTGYVKMDDMTRASEAGQTVTYELQGETADDKEGRLQLYGFSSNGVQLFSLSLIDDSQWYEATYPIIRRNAQDFLFDEKFNEPEAKTKEVRSNDTVKYENILSGRLGDWNEFQGELYIERKADVWYCYISKINGKFIESGRIQDSTNSKEKLAYLVLYIGTADTNKPSGMAINDIKVHTLSAIEPATQNIQHFELGDVVEIDFGIPSVRLNNVERNDLVDIGSQFFDLDVGETTIKIASDDEDMSFGVIFNEKFL